MSSVPEFWLESAKRKISALQQQIARLTAERDRWKTAFGDADTELESHATDRVNQRAEVAALKRENKTLRQAIITAQNQIEYMQEKFKATGSGNQVLAQIREALDAKEQG